MDSIRILDSHTGGEPTRLVLEGGPDLGEGPLDLRLRRFRERFDAFRSAIVNEPRGSDTVVGALLCKPHREECDIGVIFFNNVGYLGMCGHGTIGVIVSLVHLGMLKPGTVKIDTP
ncbi:MAG TPA: proline racemase family protein, partial [Steroidobacter sp.]|nr:proline racemase family protein [Steroidobacter sp.]